VRSWRTSVAATASTWPNWPGAGTQGPSSARTCRRACCARPGSGPRTPGRDAAADLTLVDLDQGETLLRSAFTSVTRHDFVSKLLLPGPEPVVDYVRSMSEAKYAVAPELLIPAVTDRLPGRCEGAVFEVTTHSGCLVCA
jgi:hypothetical protein